MAKAVDAAKGMPIPVTGRTRAAVGQRVATARAVKIMPEMWQARVRQAPLSRMAKARAGWAPDKAWDAVWGKAWDAAWVEEWDRAGGVTSRSRTGTIRTRTSLTKKKTRRRNPSPVDERGSVHSSWDLRPRPVAYRRFAAQSTKFKRIVELTPSRNLFEA